MDVEMLEKIGLLKSESKVYLSLLKLGSSSAGKIAKDTKLNRVSVYKALGALIENGLASYVIKANRKEYEASDPLVIKTIINKQKKELDKINNQIPALHNVFKSTKKEVETNIYEGIKGAKAIWETLLDESKTGDEWLILGAPKRAELLGGYFREWNQRRAKKKVKMRIIYNQEAMKLAKVREKQPLTKVRLMPKEYITPASLEVVGDNALLVIYQPQLIIFHLKNKGVANSFKSYFNLLWSVSN